MATQIITISPSSAQNISKGNNPWRNVNNVLTNDNSFTDAPRNGSILRTDDLKITFNPNIQSGYKIVRITVNIVWENAHTNIPDNIYLYDVNGNNIFFDPGPYIPNDSKQTWSGTITGSWSGNDLNGAYLIINFYNYSTSIYPRIYYAWLEIEYETSKTLNQDSKVIIINQLSTNQDTKLNISVSNLQVFQDSSLKISNTLKSFVDTSTKVGNQSLSKFIDTRAVLKTHFSKVHDTKIELLNSIQKTFDTEIQIGNVLTEYFDTKVIVSSTFFDTAISVINQISKNFDTAIRISNTNQRIKQDLKTFLLNSVSLVFDTKTEVYHSRKIDTKTIVSLKKQKIIDTFLNVGLFDLRYSYLMHISGKIDVNDTTVNFIAPYFALVVGDFQKLKIAQTGQEFIARKNFLGISKVFLLLGDMLNQQVDLYAFGGKIYTIFFSNYFVKVDISAPLEPQLIQNVKRINVGNRTLLVKKGRDFIRTKLELGWTNPEQTLQITDFLNKYTEFIVYIPNIDVFAVKRISDVNMNIPYSKLFRIDFEVEEVF